MTMADSGESRRRRRIAIAVYAVSVLAFLGCLRNQFVWDDHMLIVETFGFRGLALRNLRWMFTTTIAANYTPLAWLSYAFDYQLWGLDPVGFHLTNVVLHAVNAGLLCRLAAVILKAASPSCDEASVSAGAAFAALAFTLHPMRVESVAWASERRDLLAGLFFLATLLLYVRAAAERAAGKPRWGLLLAASAAFLAAALSKPSVVPLPVVLLILDYFPLRRRGSKLLLLAEKTPFILISAASCFMTIWAQINFAGLTPIEKFRASDRIAQAVYGSGFYLWKTFVPSGLLALYPLPDHLSLFDPGVIASAFLLAGLAALSFVLLGRAAALALWAFYGAMLLPVIGILHNGPQLVALRYSYLSCMGWALAAGGTVTAAWPPLTQGRWRSCWSIAAVALGLWLVMMTVLTQNQISAWETDVTVWRPIAAAYPRSLTANRNMADSFLRRREFTAAQPYVDKVTELVPEKEKDAAWVMILRATQYIGTGRLEEAHVLLARTIKADNGSEPYTLLGWIAQLRGKPEEAVERYRQAAARSPRSSAVQTQAGKILAERGRYSEAIPYYEQALRIEKFDTTARAELEQVRRLAAEKR